MALVESLRRLSHLSASCSASLWGSAARGLAAQAPEAAHPTLPQVSQTLGSGSSEGDERRVREARRRIFGPKVSPETKDGRAILARRLQGQEIASWYFLPPTEQPGFHNEEREYVLQRNQNRRKKPEAKEEPETKGKAKGKK